MRKFICLPLFILVAVCAFCQPPLTLAPSGGNKKASVSERIGLTDVTIHYDRPGVKGREGKIWGQLVHTGFTDQQFGTSKAAPWRAGANENTSIEFSTDVNIEGKPVPAGRYGFFIAYGPDESTLIFSKNSTSWGSYFYDEAEDVLRVKVKNQSLDRSVEWLKFEFMNQTENSAIIVLQWEKLSIPFKIEVDYIKHQLESFRRELRTDKGFMWEAWDQAAQWSVQHNTNLEQALAWADSATSQNFGGDRSFRAWSTKAQILQKMGKSTEAAGVMKNAMVFASMNEIHQYGRQLLGMKLNKSALEVFKTNYEKNPGQFTTLMGMARGYSATGDFTNALKFANMALPLAPAAQKAGVEAMIVKLKDGKDIN